MLRGYSTALTGSRVGPGSLKEAGRSCVVLEHARAAMIRGNVLHDCDGASPGLYGAGVLAAISAGARIIGNVIYGNAGGDGIAFSPNAQFSVARRNLIVDNSGGIYFGGDGKTASRGNRVVQNVIARSGKVVVHSAFGPNGSPVGSRNVVRGNCIWGSKRADGSGQRFHDVREPEGQPARGRAEGRRLPAVVLEPVCVHVRKRRVDEHQRHPVRLAALYRPGSATCACRLRAMLYDPPSHEPLTDRPWDEDRVRAAIAAIVAETESAFDEGELWPAHPRDLDDGPLPAVSSLYPGRLGGDLGAARARARRPRRPQPRLGARRRPAGRALPGPAGLPGSR